MTEVTVYTREHCPYCHAALALLAGRNARVSRIDAGSDPQMRDQMIARSGGASTYPQIFIADKHIGGFDDLSALDGKGELEALLQD